MPIDPVLAAGVAPPKLIDPFTMAAQAQGLANARQQQQIGAQQLQGGDLALQEKQRELNDQNIFSAAMAKAGGDPQKGLILAAQGGMSGKGILGLQQMLLKNQETRSTITKNEGEGASAQAAAQQKSNEMVVGTTGALLNLPPSQRAAAYPAAMQKLAKDMGVDPATLPQDYASFGGDQALIAFHDQHLTQGEQLAAQDAAQKKAAADQKLIEDKAEATRKAALAPSVQKKAENEAITTAPNAAGLTPAAEREAKDRAAALAQKTANDKAQRGQEGAKLALDQKKFDATFGAGLDANGKPLSPEDRKAVALLDPTAVAQANYQIAGPTSPRNGMPSPQMAKVLAINPAYDGTKFPERNKIALDFSASGASGKSITSSDTALAHLDAVRRAGEALHNKDPRFINAIANEFGVQIGSSPKNTYDAILNMVAPEISKAVIGEAGGEAERQQFQKPFSSDASDEQREQAIGATANLLGARFHKMTQAYESDMGKPLERKLSPESQAVLDRYTKPSGAAAIPTPTSQAEYNALQKGAQFKKPNDSTVYTKQ